MEAQDRSVAGKMMFLLKQMHIKPIYLAVPIGLSLLSAVFEGAGMGLLIPILNGFLQKSFAFIADAPIIGKIFMALPEHIQSNDRMLFGILLGGFVVVYITKTVTRYLSVVSVGYFSERALHHLRKVLFTRYLSFGKLFFDTSNVGHHNILLTEFSRHALHPMLIIDRYINALFSLAIYLVVMFMISWRLTLIALPLFVFLHFAIKFMITRIKAISRVLAKRGSELGKKSVEILSTIPLVKSYRTERLEQDHYSHISDEKAKLDFKIRILQALILPSQEVITLLAAVAIFVGALMWLGREQVASAPALVIYFYIILNASHKFGTISGFRGSIAACTGPLDEVMKIFSDEGKHYVKDGDKSFDGLKENIEFKNLTFSYADEREVLKNVSFSVKKGKMTAIVGPTGSGKSTLINLIMRYYDCDPARIMIDGNDVREFTLDSFLKHVALVSQETLLLHDSLKNNITYGLSEVSEEDLREAVERARLSELISLLPEGLDTLIGDRGVKLSGGEKQRVSIARALLKGSEILILDEATSSLDSKTEKLIQEAIDEAVTDRTAIVIAHRLSTIQHSDKILVLEDGEIKEQGTLDELLAKKGAFHGL
ncbi:MAG: ABC transporter ATP-binding protein, partial [Candidatus Peribacteraceae bacterium]|nr:ABC transporter ATP-binding protein [Candidatus Peribacteraceae bacterium]